MTMIAPTEDRTSPVSAATHRRRTAPRRAALALLITVTLTMIGCSTSDASDRAAAGPTTTAPSSPTTTAVPHPTTARDEVVSVAGGRLHIRCAGEGSSTVLLLAGFEADADIWTAVTPDLEDQTRVCAYDRFGTGTSSPPPGDQTFESQVDDLHDLLDAAGEPGPYVVVGHSFGGAEAVTFASTYPGEVVGVLLLDASPATWPDTACAVRDDGSDVAASFRTACATFEPDGNTEALDAHAAFGLVAQIDSVGDVPMIVAPAAERAYAGLAEAEATRLRSAWDDGQTHWASLSTTSEVVPVADTGHTIQIDQPARVVALIERLVS